MIAYNHVIIIGNLTRDPDVKTVGTPGMKIARLSVCINEKRKTQDGRVIDTPIFIDVDAWARLADMCEKYLSKNSNVFIEGRLQMSQWEKDGVKHQKIKIRASNIKFLPKGGKYTASQKSNGKTSRTKQEDAEVNPPVAEDGDTFVPEEVADNGGDEGFAETIRGW